MLFVVVVFVRLFVRIGEVVVRFDVYCCGCDVVSCVLSLFVLVVWLSHSCRGCCVFLRAYCCGCCLLLWLFSVSS